MENTPNPHTVEALDAWMASLNPRQRFAANQAAHALIDSGCGCRITNVDTGTVHGPDRWLTEDTMTGSKAVAHFARTIEGEAVAYRRVLRDDWRDPFIVSARLDLTDGAAYLTAVVEPDGTIRDTRMVNHKGHPDNDLYAVQAVMDYRATEEARNA